MSFIFSISCCPFLYESPLCPSRLSLSSSSFIPFSSVSPFVSSFFPPILPFHCFCFCPFINESRLWPYSSCSLLVPFSYLALLFSLSHFFTLCRLFPVRFSLCYFFMSSLQCSSPLYHFSVPSLLIPSLSVSLYYIISELCSALSRLCLFLSVVFLYSISSPSCSLLFSRFSVLSFTNHFCCHALLNLLNFSTKTHSCLLFSMMPSLNPPCPSLLSVNFTVISQLSVIPSLFVPFYASLPSALLFLLS